MQLIVTSTTGTTRSKSQLTTAFPYNSCGTRDTRLSRDTFLIYYPDELEIVLKNWPKHGDWGRADYRLAKIS